jgi:transmembrane sensor
MSSVIEEDDIEDVAAQWVLRQDRGELSPEEQRDLDAWLERDSRHRGAFVRAQAMWVDLDRIAALNAGRPTSDQPVVQRMPLMRAAAIAGICFAAALSAFGVSRAYLAGRETTDLGEIRRITLNDGSAVALNTSSVMQVKFEREQRRIVLRRGEASFQVSHDEQRPFIVQAGDVSVRAVGTAFTVRLREDGGVGVVVTEGVIEVTRADGSSDTYRQKERVSRNHEVIAETRQPIETAALSQSEVARRLAWEEGQLVFDGEHLEQAAAEVNRYAPIPVVIDTPRLAGKSFVGVFRTGDARAFAQAAAAAFDARVYEDAGILHLTE